MFDVSVPLKSEIAPPRISPRSHAQWAGKGAIIRVVRGNKVFASSSFNQRNVAAADAAGIPPARAWVVSRIGYDVEAEALQPVEFLSHGLSELSALRTITPIAFGIQNNHGSERHRFTPRTTRGLAKRVA